MEADKAMEAIKRIKRIRLRLTQLTRQEALRIAAAFAAVAILILLFHALLTPASVPPPTRTPGPAAPLVGHYAPAVTMRDLTDHGVLLSSLRGKVALLNFWYAECEPCRLEMPVLERTYEADKARGFVVVGLNIVDDVQTTATFVHQFGITYPVYRDPSQDGQRMYQVTRIPTSFFIDRQGVIRKIAVGPMLDSKQLQQDVANLL